MTFKMKLKVTVDILMTILLLLLMGYMVTGEAAHEWLGMGMFFLFFFHNGLNIQWYRGLFRGTYSLYRVIHTAVNLLLLLMMLGLMFSSVILSRYVFSFLPISGGMSLARDMHMVCSYWAFVLMSVHLGLHWGMMMSMMKRAAEMTAGAGSPGVSGGSGSLRTTFLRILAVGVAVYGAWAFVKNDLFSYMTMKNRFVFFDYEQPVVLFFAEYIAMMELWACAAYYLSGVLKKRPQSKRKKEEEGDIR